ncbi:hypothetical protein CesoFtcFv8_013222 [Champsocephalus esox]|uniref:Prolactin regulatory element-binding protein n=1 Tax=Champsocephalus esox TaxID=159716 RepID=A0AAN8BZ60_9TELE|nr:hypothetical protein CesoFtcFv8_013222 [Champsocephalus esox]
MGRRRVPDLYRAPFPLYTIKVDPRTGLVITAGGGGASKTGIKNAMHFLDLQLVGEQQYSASLLHAHDTDTHAARRERRTSRRGTARGRPGDGGGKGDRRGQDEAAASGDKSDTKDETSHISVTPLAEVQSDLNPKDPLQKVVRFSPDLSLLLTGGSDGHIRVWEYPSLKKKYDFKAHGGEIEDLDMSPGNKHLVTVGRDFSCSVWSGSQLAMGLNWLETTPQIAEKTYRHMACRFGKWDGKSFLPMLTAPCGSEVISSLAVSDSGTFLGLGTVTGSVAIYIAFSLQKLYYVQESHGIVVTDLAFLPDSLKGKDIRGNNETAMLSVAVDSRCQIHTIPNRRSFPIWLVLFCCGLMVVGVVLLLQYLFPGFI